MRDHVFFRDCIFDLLLTKSYILVMEYFVYYCLCNRDRRCNHYQMEREKKACAAAIFIFAK